MKARPSSEFPSMTNNRILTCINGLPTDRTPVWIMRQAGPYLPEFQEMLKKNDYISICQNPELASEATLIPVRRFGFDAACIISDIAIIPLAMGMEVVPTFEMAPRFPKPLVPDRVDKLKVQGAIDRLTYVAETITLTRHKLKGEATLVGSCGAPWTLMSYMIEGGDSRNFAKAKKWIYAYENKMRTLLTMLSNVVADFCIMQAMAGAQVIQLYENNAKYLDKEVYTEFCLPGLKTIRQRVKAALKDLKCEVPMVIYAKGCVHSLNEFVLLEYDVIGIDWTTEPIHVRSTILPREVCLQGNLDPCGLFAPPKDIHVMVYQMLRKFEGSKVIANLGDMIYPNTPLEGVEAFVKAVRKYDEGTCSSSSDDNISLEGTSTMSTLIFANDSFIL